MAIDKDRIKKQQRKRVYEKNKKNVKRSADIDLSQSESKGDVIDSKSTIILPDKKKVLNNTVKGVEKHIYSDYESNDDTAKQNVELYKNTVETVVSKISDIALNKQDNVSHKSNILSDNSTHNRKDTRINKNNMYTLTHQSAF